VDASSIVTSAPPVVTVVNAPSVCQYAPGAEVTSVELPASEEPQTPASGATHEPLHNVPEVHWQAPAWQSCPVGQGMPQPPQFVGSAETSRHVVPQGVSPAVQIVPGSAAPFEQAANELATRTAASRANKT